jgi:hypothetical protein
MPCGTALIVYTFTGASIASASSEGCDLLILPLSGAQPNLPAQHIHHIN